MLSAPEFQVMLERYDDDPGLCSKMLRTHALAEPKTFLEYAQTAILERPVSRAIRFVTGMAISAGLIERLLQVFAHSRSDAVALAKKVLSCDPHFDIKMTDYLVRPQPGKVVEESAYFGILDILEAISEGDRLVPAVLKILKHPNPKIRSKAALFIGSRTQNPAWAASRTQDYDARVRANILESLFGLNSEFVHQLFRNNIHDENNRVAGNAVLGLYLLGDTASISLIYDMARHPDARFRNTAAWIMGRTGDPRFAQAFSELMNDPDQLVRAQAFKGLGHVRKALRGPANREQLKASIAKVASSPATHSLMATVCDALGQPVQGIPPTSFILKAGSPAKFVREFNINEYDCRSSLYVAFIMCLPAADHSFADMRFTEAIQACNGSRRSKDKWGIVKINGVPTRTDRAAAPAPKAIDRHRQWIILNVNDMEQAGPLTGAYKNRFEYSAAQPRIDAMLRDAPVSVGDAAGDETTKLIIDAVLHSDIASGKPHVIFLGGGPKHRFLEALEAKGPDLPAVVHVLAVSDAWQDASVQEMAKATGGIYKRVRLDEAAQACFDIHTSLLHHYILRWKEGLAPLELDIYAEAGKASAAYECDAVTPEPVRSALSA